MRPIVIIIVLLVVSTIGIWNWQTKQHRTKLKNRVVTHQFTNVLKNVRLGDGTLLGVETYVEWKVDSLNLFYEQFDSMAYYAVMVLYPRQSELCNRITVNYDKRAFKKEKIKEQLKHEIQALLFAEMGEKSIAIQKVTIKNIFVQYALEEVIAALKEKKSQKKQPKKKTSKTNNTSSKSDSKHLNELGNMKTSTIELLKKVEIELNEKLVINSAYRTKAHNKKVGGVSNSAHLRGYAVDIAIYSKAHRTKMVNALKKVGFKRIGLYDTHVHADNDPNLKNAIWYD